ncbi:MAG: hypothetical protein WB816_12000 [Methylocystis sp.]
MFVETTQYARSRHKGRAKKDPCALTPAEERLIAAVAEHGDVAQAALALGLVNKSFSDRFKIIREKLDVSTTAAAIEACRARK